MRKILVGTVLLLILSLNVFSQCSLAQREIYVPAVVNGQEGGLLSIIVRTQPGDGEVYTRINPVVGASTQISQTMAVQEAFTSAAEDPKTCNVYFEFEDMGNSPAVDGPSAGLAMTIALKSALEGTQIRQDIAVTGAIASGGYVGPVGGIIDKAQATSRENKKILITPKQAIYENILLSKLSEEYDFVALEATTLQQAYNIATSKEGKNYSPNFELQTEKIPTGLPIRELNEDDKRFVKVATAINDELLGATNFEMDGELTKYSKHFAKQAEINNQIIAMGYGYTAANNAFLSQIDAAFLKTPPHKLDLEQEILEAQNCVEDMPQIEPTAENLEWVAGANARRNWALSRIKTIVNESNDYYSQEEKYLALREIYYAHSWCLAGTQILKQAEQIGGKQINSTQLEDYARVKLKSATKLYENSIIKNPESKQHLQNANEAIEKKDWAAVIFDSAYSAAMQRASNDQNEMDDNKLEQGVLYLSSQKYQTLWARTYQSQGIYTAAKAADDEQTPLSSYSVLMLAQSMEEVFLDFEPQTQSSTISFEIDPNKEQDGLTTTVVAVIVWGSILLLVAQLTASVLKK